MEEEYGDKLVSTEITGIYFFKKKGISIPWIFYWDFR